VKQLQLRAFLLGWDEGHRAEIRKGLAEHAIFDVVGESGQWNEALQFMTKHEPDVVFGTPQLGEQANLSWVDQVPRTIAVVLVAPHPAARIRPAMR
jgi:AmiR/NasT family two-component response regulator